ncbi:hypothetical protein EYD45_05450 [Hyunsoonleella flava]|uniref:Metal-dependent hydrolase n=1 Tax=Hyunsoonleella flava TaxID=2527939 RepID=A0A4Q9FKB5_9FLAO|nr:DUF6122 family protein [Hyunsoonleella flava]TBN04708.1 hypothetical protein EYD45_05450 [Hyunsoonleella flava]
MIQPIAHYGCHLLLPLLVAVLFFKVNWKIAYLIMLAGFLIDIDHLLASPIFDPNRCSIGFHPLHSSFAILFYIFLCFPKKSRIVGLGLVIHIIADVVDCTFI